MRMDLTCPAEFVSVEVLRDSGGRAQAYLTFRNLSEDTLVELRAMVTMLDGEGASLGQCPLRYRRLQAKPHALFTLCMVMDELPFFRDARVTLQRVVFAQGEPWVSNEDAQVDCTPKPLASGPQRSALMAVAGPDAVCWPERRQDTWVCVCGRFNLRPWRICRRCRRNRDDTFARYELNAVMAQYQRQRNAQEGGERTEKRQAERTPIVQHNRRQADFMRRIKVLRARRRGLAMALIAVVLIAWGLFSR